MSGTVIARNAVFNVLSFCITLLVTFLLIPVMLNYLGPTGFGVWAIVRVLVSYASLADLGLSSTVTKYVAELKAKNDDEGIVRILHSAFFLYAGVALVLLVLVWLFEGVATRTLFATSGEFSTDVRFVLYGSILIFSANLIFSIFSSAITGIQRMDTTNTILSIYWILNGGLMYFALVSGYGLRGLVYANGIATAFAILLNAIFFFRYFRGGRYFSLSVRLGDLMESLRYSKDIFVIAISNSVHLHFDKLLISSFLSLSTVSSYEVASKVVQQMRQIPILLLSPILPAASELEAQGQSEKIRRMYYLSLKYIIALCVPMFACVGVFAIPLIDLWLGGGNALIAATLTILIVPNFLNLMTGPAYFISLGIGKARYGMYSSTIGLVANVLLSYYLLQAYGYFGAVAGTLIALTSEAILFLVLIHRVLEIYWGRFLNLFLHPLGAISLGIVAALGVGSFVEPLLPRTVLMLTISIVTYLVALYRPRYFGADDLVFLRDFKARFAQRFWSLGQRE